MKLIAMTQAAAFAATEPIDLRKAVIGCPIRASLGALGHKWGLLVLRDIAFCQDVRFSDILRNIDGLTARTLTFRLGELQREGFIRKGSPGRRATYELTRKGQDAMPILAALTRFGVYHQADEVFRDGQARTLEQIVPERPDEVLGATAVYAVKGRHVRIPTARPQKRLAKPGRPRLAARA
jgi:DNA-binding HxlR family transcriptional regulator